MCSLKHNLNVLFWDHNKSFKHKYDPCEWPLTFIANFDMNKVALAAVVRVALASELNHSSFTILMYA